MKPEDFTLVRRVNHSVAGALARHGYYYGTLGYHFFAHLIDAARAEGRAEAAQAEPFAHFQWNDGWKVWEQVVDSAAGKKGVVAAYRRAKRPSLPVGDEAAGAEWSSGFPYGWQPAGDDRLTTEAFAWADDTGVGRGSGAYGYFVRAFIAGALLALSRGCGVNHGSVDVFAPLSSSRDDGRSEATPSEGGET